MSNKKICCSVFLSLCTLISTGFAATVTTSVSNTPLQQISSSQVLRLIPANTPLTQTGESGSFYKVTYNNLEGYVYKGFTVEGANQVNTNNTNNSSAILNNSAIQVTGSKVKRTITWTAQGKTFTSTGYEIIYPKFNSQFLKFSSSETSQINPVLGQRLEKLAQDLGEVIPISSGFRSMKAQVDLIHYHLKTDPQYALGGNGMLAKNGVWLTSAPGTSRHQLALAVDVKNTGIGKTIRKMSNAQLAPYGLYKPMSYENWHIEPIETKNMKD